MGSELTQTEVRAADYALHAAYPGVFPETPWQAMSRACEILSSCVPKGGRVVDIGGGVSVISGVLAKLGCEVYVLDNFEYDIGWIAATGSEDFKGTTARRREILAAEGVRFIECDLCEVAMGQFFQPETVDAVVSFHCFEHLHHSPQRLLQSVLETLRPGGKLLIETPNAVNLLKRFKVLAGYTNYHSYRDYWNAQRFGGHVREYSCGDFHDMAKLLGVSDYRVYGRNWFGSLSVITGRGPAFTVVDHLLRFAPGLCGSLFFEVHKPSL
jgi:SAM-dependent methyltransferase